MSALALRIGSEVYGIELDYSTDSIKNVEKILGNLHKEYKKTRNDEGFTGIALEFGAYIVKVIEKNVGPVRWERDHPEFGEASFPLYIGESTIFPMNWCTKRLYDGPGDDIWSKYCYIILKEDPQPEKRGFLGKLFGK